MKRRLGVKAGLVLMFGRWARLFCFAAATSGRSVWAENVRRCGADPRTLRAWRLAVGSSVLG